MSERYHHGDLRNTLIQLGTEMLIEKGEASISLRQLAQRAGVSHNAPYQHFADKDALLAAIAEDGFRMLAEAMEAADTGSASDPQARLTALGRSYVQFALAHPSHLQLMFGTFPSSDYPSLQAASYATFERLAAAVNEIRAAGQLASFAPEDAAAMLWMLVHGLSAILIADKIPESIRRGRTADELTEMFVEMVCVGLLSRP
jgi:AcrR family transcriptional regulator